MTDIVVINPGGGNVIYQDLDNGLTGIEPPLWCRIIAGYCEDADHTVVIDDQQFFSLGRPKAEILYCIAAYGHQPNASTQSMYHAEIICRNIKAVSDVPVIIVGGHVAALPERTLRESGADYVCNGEGPVTVERLLNCLKTDSDVSQVPGLVWKGSSNPPPEIADIDDKHGNVWDKLPMDRYRAHNWQCFDGSPRTPYASIHTSLNCPFKCNFCCISAPFGGPGYQTRKTQDVVTEVEMLYREYNVTTLKISDEMFVLKPSHYLPICESLAALPFADELNIWAYARVDTIKPDTLALLRKAGIRWLCLGIESGSAHVRDGALKPIDDNGIRDAVKAIQNAGINVLGNFIFGLPDDTLESMQATFDLARLIECEYSNFYSAMPYPGSKLFLETPLEHLPKAWSGYSQHSRDTTPLPTATLSGADVLRFRDDAFIQYFEDPAYIDRVGEKFGDHAVREIEFMTSHKIERDLLT